MLESTRLLTPLALVVPLLSLSCASEEATIEVRVWGEDFIEAGIPADELADGWAVSFERFEVELSDIAVADARFTDSMVFDLSEDSEGRGQLIGEASTAAGDFDASFVIGTVEIEGSATKEGVTKTFSWTFTTSTQYSGCETTTELVAGELGSFEITVHADHLFYDSIVAEEPGLRFDPIAAADDAGDGDGVVSQAELEAADLGAYDPGNLDLANLWAFVAAQAQTMGHVDGEGHCESSS